MTTEDVALALLRSQIERCILQVDALWFKEQIPVSWDAALLFKLEAAKFNAEMDAVAGADLDKAHEPSGGVQSFDNGAAEGESDKEKVHPRSVCNDFQRDEKIHLIRRMTGSVAATRACADVVQMRAWKRRENDATES
jgi:hypothetical protein